MEELAQAGYSARATRRDAVRLRADAVGLQATSSSAKRSPAGVLVLPARVFHHGGYFRFSLTGSERMLERALPILGQFAPAMSRVSVVGELDALRLDGTALPRAT